MPARPALTGTRDEAIRPLSDDVPARLTDIGLREIGDDDERDRLGNGRDPTGERGKAEDKGRHADISHSVSSFLLMRAMSHRPVAVVVWRGILGVPPRR